MIAPSAERFPWTEVSPKKFDAGDFVPYSYAEIGHLFDWGENPNGKSTHFIPYRGQCIVDIVEFDANCVHQPHKPGDEIVLVVNGTLILTTDGSKQEQVFEEGEAVLIPRGWAGMYRVLETNGPFREFTLVPVDYFDPTLKAALTGGSPLRLTQPADAGIHTLHEGMFDVKAGNYPAGHAWQFTTHSDEAVFIRAGTLTLKHAGAETQFTAGDIVVIPAGITASASATPGYQVLIAVWP